MCTKERSVRMASIIGKPADPEGDGWVDREGGREGGRASFEV